MTFQVGDKVIYPNHGLGVVERIEDKTILGTTCGFYHLRILANETTVLVPLPNADGVGLRRAISDEEVERLFGLLSDGKIDDHQNWKGRFKDNSDKMRSGSIYDVADVLKSLTFLARSKSLSFREKRMLDRARFLIISEVSEVMRETSQQIEGKVEQALERSFLRQGARRAACDDRPREARAGRGGEGGAGRVREDGAAHAAQRRGRSPDGARVVAASPRIRRHARRTTGPNRFSGSGLLFMMRRCPWTPAAEPAAVGDAPSLNAAAPVRPSPRTVLAAIRSVVTYLAIALYVLLVAPPALLLADRLPLEEPAVRARARAASAWGCCCRASGTA